MGENTKRYVAEFFGTAVLVLIGCGAVAIGTNATGPTAVNVLGIAFAFGLAVTAMAYGIGPISGCHINPAVPLGMTSAGRLPAREVIGLTLFALHFPFINVTGLSVNPARSLGPAVLVGGKALAQVWLFLIVPSVAGACAGLLFREAGASPTARGAS